MHALSEIFRYKVVNDHDYRKWLYGRGNKLIEYTRDGRFQTIVFVDRAARPIYWLFEQLWQKMMPEVPLLSHIMLRVGHEKRLRDVYMHEKGLAIQPDGSGRFVGVYDTPQNIRLFKKRIRQDAETQRRFAEEVREHYSDDLLRQKRVLIVDDMEFEGVTRLFLETILARVFSPKSIDYFEFGDMQFLPTGLAGARVAHGFIAKESANPKSRANAATLKKDLSMIVEEFFPRV